MVWSFHQQLADCRYVGLCQSILFHSFDLHVFLYASLLIFLSLWFCCIIWNWVLCYILHCFVTQIYCFVFEVFWCSSCVVGLFYLLLWGVLLQFQWGFTVCIGNFGYHNCLDNVNFSDPHTWDVFPSFSVLINCFLKCFVLFNRETFNLST